MAHSFERRAVVGQIRLGQRAEGIRLLEALEYARIDIERDPGAVAGLREQQLLLGRPLIVDGSHAGERAPVRHQEIVHVVVEIDVVETAEKRLQGAQHHAGRLNARTSRPPTLTGCTPRRLSKPWARWLPVFIQIS